MNVPHYDVEIPIATTYKFRFEVSRNGVAEDLTTWSNLWFAAKRNPLDEDAAAVLLYVLFAGVERVFGEPSLAEVTILPNEWTALDDGVRHSLVADVGGIDGDLNVYQIMTLGITVVPRIRRSNF